MTFEGGLVETRGDRVEGEQFAVQDSRNTTRMCNPAVSKDHWTIY